VTLCEKQCPYTVNGVEVKIDECEGIERKRIGDG
jgi:hypothetical protein